MNSIENQAWIKTDDLQWVKQVDDEVFEIVNVFDHLDNKWLNHSLQICDSTIDLGDYSDEELNRYVNDNYDSITRFKQIYGEASNQIIAELISEDEATNNSTMHLYQLNDCVEILEFDYGIDVKGLKVGFEQRYASNSKKHNRNSEMDM